MNSNMIDLKRNRAPKLNRRSFLAGSGIALSLPLLEAMLPIGKTAFAAESSPGRMITVFTGNGIHMQTFTPTQTGSTFTLPATLQPFVPVQSDMLVLTGIENAPAKIGGTGDHGKGSGAFLTCAPARKSPTDLFSATSMDQVAAQVIGSATKFPSLELSIDGGGGIGGNCDNNYSCAYMRNISWSTPTTPQPSISNARQAFDRLFSSLPTGNPQANISAINKSVIDAVLADVNRLNKQLGTNDREKLQEYLNSIRQLETQLASGGQTQPVGACMAPTRPESTLDYRATSRAMNDIMVMAFQCDLTRIATYMLSSGLSGRQYSHLGISSGHHSISHHGGLQSNYDLLQKIDKYHMEEVSYLVQKLKATKDIQGNNLLDSTVVYYSSEISDGNYHNHDNLPILLFGKCNGRFKTGRHIKYTNRPQLASLYLNMLEAVGAPQASFGNSSTKLTDLA